MANMVKGNMKQENATLRCHGWTRGKSNTESHCDIAGLGGDDCDEIGKTYIWNGWAMALIGLFSCEVLFCWTGGVGDWIMGDGGRRSGS